jgi:hypothetical protein
MSEPVNIPQLRPIPPARRALRRRHLVMSVSTTASRRGLPVVVPAVAALLAVALAAAAYGAYSLTVPSHMQLLAVDCYAGPSLSAEHVTVSSDRRSPADACAASWPTSFPGRQQPSALAACIPDSGALAVFPADESICGQLGLEAFSGQEVAAAEAARSAALLAAVDDALQANGCLSSAEALQRVEAVLDEHGLTDWRAVVADGQSFPASACATATVDAPANTVTIAPK